MSCGVCVPIMTQLMATRGVGALYELNRQCEELRASGPLPQGAAEVVESATEEVGRKAQWTGRYISTKRTEYACRLVNRQETAGLDLVRDHDHEAITELHLVP